MREIYLDYNASTPIDPVVADAMRLLLEGTFGNPSSGHWAGTPAKSALENARRDVAGLLGCAADEVIFTSGGSEANNLALKGVFFALRDKGNHIVTSAIEHPATITTCKFLERLSNLSSRRSARSRRSGRSASRAHAENHSDQRHAGQQ